MSCTSVLLARPLRDHKVDATWLQGHTVGAEIDRHARRARSALISTLFRDAAGEIKAILDEEGVGDMLIGVDVVEPPMSSSWRGGLDVRDGQQTMLLARETGATTRSRR